ncbi:MAG: TonB-dependent receptor [Candidatus Thiodiazotropha sp. L084R]
MPYIAPYRSQLRPYNHAYAYRGLTAFATLSMAVSVGNRERARDDTRNEIDDYSIVNLTLRRKKLFEHLDLAMAVRNLFDEDVREPSTTVIPDDYPMSSREIWAEVQISL